MPDRKTQRISIVNHKGGVGKTTTAINLAAGLGARGYRVLLVDWDPQGNATQFVGLAQLVETDGVYGSANFAWGEAPFAPQRQVLPGVDLLPGTEELAFLEERMLTNAVTGAAFRLAQALEQVASDYQYIIADCGPTIGMMAMSAMIACPNVLMPIELAYGSIPGRAKREHRQLDLMAALELSALFNFLETKVDGEKAAKRVEALVTSALERGWTFRAVQDACQKEREKVRSRAAAAADGQDRAAAPETGASRPLFRTSERELTVYRSRLATAEATQKVELRGLLAELVRALG